MCNQNHTPTSKTPTPLLSHIDYPPPTPSCTRHTGYSLRLPGYPRHHPTVVRRTVCVCVGECSSRARTTPSSAKTTLTRTPTRGDLISRVPSFCSSYGGFHGILNWWDPESRDPPVQLPTLTAHSSSTLRVLPLRQLAGDPRLTTTPVTTTLLDPQAHRHRMSRAP